MTFSTNGGKQQQKVGGGEAAEPTMASSDMLQTSEPPPWFSSEMKRFTDTIETSIKTQIHKVDVAVGKLVDAMALTQTRVTAVETKCSEYEATVVDLRQTLAEQEEKHQTELIELRSKLEQYENKQRSRNLRLGSRLELKRTMPWVSWRNGYLISWGSKQVP